MKLGVLIGRFQPLHKGHKALLLAALDQCDTLLVLVGSSYRPRSIMNPWTYEERKEVLQDFFYSYKISRARILPIEDYKYSNNQWISNVRDQIEAAKQSPEDSVTLFGHNKPGNDYLSWFPDYEYTNIETHIGINGESVREQMLRENSEKIPKSVVDDWHYYAKERQLFANYPFPETLNFNCGDVLLECSGHVLLVQRKFAPGAGMWAMPGGFKNANETFFDCAIRELIEETNVRIPEKVLRGSVVKKTLYDSPKRNYGIPRNTLLVHIKVNPDADGSLPRANGADDAAEVRWIPINELRNYDLFDDHQDAILFELNINN